MLRTIRAHGSTSPTLSSSIPIGTGFSRASVPEAEAKKLFYSTTPDIEYLSRVIYDWLVKNDRLGSSKYLVGESYGGYRGPRITYYLQSQLGVAMNGVVLVSPYLNPTIEDDGDSVADALDDDAAFNYRGASGAREEAHAGSDGRCDRLHAQASTRPRCSKAGR